MNLKAQRPIFVPEQFSTEIEQMSKAALMDLVWDLAVTAGAHDSEAGTMKTLRERRDVILLHRAQAKKPTSRRVEP